MKKIQTNCIILTIIIISIITLLTLTSYFIIKNNKEKPSGKENITTKLSSETDFLNWFIDFDNLYNEKVKNPKYSLTKESFEKINNFLNNQDSYIYFKENIYYINESTTIELDINTKSFRYIKYNNDIIIEILEVNLKNGIYYVQLANQEHLYKIAFNKNKVKNNKKLNKNNKVIIHNSIYAKNNFEW